MSLKYVDSDFFLRNKYLLFRVLCKALADNMVFDTMLDAEAKGAERVHVEYLRFSTCVFMYI